MASNYNSLKAIPTDKERLAMAWEVVEQTMAGQTVTPDQLNTAQWVIHHLSPRYDNCQSAPGYWLPTEEEVKPKKKKRKGKKK